MAFLGPDIIHVILDGTQPSHLILADLPDRNLPLPWQEQRQKLGLYKKQSS